MVMDLGLKFYNMVTIYTITYNEELMIEFFITHYRTKFPNCNIVIYDNESTDNTVNIAKKHGCEIITYSTENTLTDQKYLDIKNNCWKTSNTDWNIICDCDELIEVTEDDILKEETFGTNCFKFNAYSMMNNLNKVDIPNMKYGFRDILYDKNYLFNKKFFNELNYDPGCHTFKPIMLKTNNLIFSEKPYRAFHYKYLSPQYTIDRNMLFNNRLSDENKSKRWGIQYTFSPESVINYYKDQKNKLIKLLN